MARLGDLYQITSGGTPSRKHFEYYQDGTIPWVKTGDLKEKYLRATDEKITEIGLKNSSARIYPKDTVLIAMYGATIGASSILKIEAATNQACAAFVKRDDVIPEYLYAFLESQQSRFIKDAVGGAQPNISAGYLKEIDMPLISIEEQRRIAALLDKVSDLIAKRRAQLDKLDLLVKARFVEMFGDPVINPYSWNVSTLSDLGDCKNGMNFHTDDSGVVIHCLGVGDFKDLSLIEDTSKLPKISLNEMPSDDYLLVNGDIVFVRSNGNKALVGRSVAVYPNDIPTTFSGFCIRFRIQNPAILPSYLLRVLKTDSMRKKMAGRGANIQNLNQKILAELRIPIPGLALQEEYELFIKKVDKSKLTIQRSFDKLEILKKALMQQYFG